MSGFVKQASGIFRTVKDACITFVVPGQCLHCGSRFMDSEDVFCTEKCSSDYWTQYRTKKGKLPLDCAIRYMHLYSSGTTYIHIHVYRER